MWNFSVRTAGSLLFMVRFGAALEGFAEQDVIFGLRYDTAAKTYSMNIFSGEMESYYIIKGRG